MIPEVTKDTFVALAKLLTKHYWCVIFLVTLPSADGSEPVCRHELVDMSEQENMHFYCVTQHYNSLPRLSQIYINFSFVEFSFCLTKTRCPLYT